MGAGVPVVASDLPGMAPIVRDTGCGELCDPNDPADIARAIRAIVDAPPSAAPPTARLPRRGPRRVRLGAPGAGAAGQYHDCLRVSP